MARGITFRDKETQQGLRLYGGRDQVIEVESLAATRADLAAKGIEPEADRIPRRRRRGPRTCWITHPDRYRIEVLQ